MKLLETKLFVVSRKNLSLSIAEVSALYPSSVSAVRDNFVFVKCNKKDDIKFTKLAFTKAVYSVLFSCHKKELFTFIEKYNWNKIIKKDKIIKKNEKTYCVRSEFQEKNIASLIWHSLHNPKVDLKAPDILFRFFFIGNTVYATTLLWKNPQKFLQRKAHQRPGFYPASLSPQLALAMVNLSGVISGTIIDPFCGTGGILIEAAFSGRKAYGFDVSNWMLEKCKKNLAFYRLKVPVSVGDATRFQKKCDAIVTELPFGKNTKSQDLELLYRKFLENAAQNTAKIVVSFPDFVDYKKIIKKSRWKIKEDFLWYLHHSLSKWIVVMEKNKIIVTS